MKRSFILMVAILAGGLLLSCSPSPNHLSSGTIVRQYNQYLKESAQQKNFITVEVGEYELNGDGERYRLRMLQAAGLVTYNVKRLPWWEKSVRTYRKSVPVTRYFYGYSYTDEEYRWVSEDVYNFEDHYIVQVELTKKGQSLVVDALPEPIDKEDKDLKSPEVDPSKYAWNKVDLTENWKTIENPFLKKQASGTTENRETETHTTTATPRNSTEETVQEDNTERIEKSMYDAYKNFSPNSHTVVLKGFGIKAVKARNIQINTSRGYPEASAEVILSSINTTDAARIYRGVEDGQKQLVKASLTYYLDKGWVLDDKDSLEDYLDD